jgi:hypothetical protein
MQSLFHPKDSCIITRDANKVANIRHSPLYQTNRDLEDYGNKNNDNIIWSKERESKLERILLSHGNDFYSANVLKGSLDVWPVINIETVYRCVASLSEIETEVVVV